MTAEQRGDPEGRRRARQRALKLSEANRLANRLRALLEDARFPFDGLTAMQTQMSDHERVEWQRAQGRIESRRKHSLASTATGAKERALSFLFVDESGVPWPQPHRQNDVLALGGVALTEQEIARYQSAVRQLKLEFWNQEDIVLHEPMLRKHKGIFYFDGDTDLQKRFCQWYAELLDGLDFIVFGVSIRKSSFASPSFLQQGDDYFPADAYGIAIHLLLERYTDYLASSSPTGLGNVSFERQGPREDAVHQFEYARLLVQGTQWVSATEFRHLLQPGLTFTPKSASHPMELADLVAREIYEWVAGGCVSRSSMWDVLTSKIYKRTDGLRGTFGVKVFPDSDLREHILAHRNSVSN